LRAHRDAAGIGARKLVDGHRSRLATSPRQLPDGLVVAVLRRLRHDRDGIIRVRAHTECLIGR
jgi:hypothetical protein